MPGVVARPSSEAAGSAGPFRVLERFHLAIAVVTIVAATVFLLALTIMLVDERRETVGILRLIGLPARRVLVQVLIEGLIVAGAGAAFGLVLAVLSEGLINAFFQWRYDTALVFVRISRDVALTSTAIAVPLGASATVRRVLGAAAPQRTPAGPTMNAVGFAWRSLVRQPARATLGVLGVAAVGALLFDMLLLSQGLIVSMRDLLDRSGWDIRVSAGELPGRGGRVPARREHGRAHRRAAVGPRGTHRDESPTHGSSETAARPSPPRSKASADVRTDRDPITPPWTVVRGRDARGANEVVIDNAIASAANLQVGSTITLRASCVGDREALPPARLQVVGIAEFPFARNKRGRHGRLARRAESRLRGQRRRRGRPAARHLGPRLQRDRRRHSRGWCRTSTH